MADMIPEAALARLAEKFRILGDVSRLAILHRLIEDGEMSVGQVVEATGRTQANISKHLKLMAEAAMLTRRKEGLQVFYGVNNPLWEQVIRLVSNSLREGGDP